MPTREGILKVLPIALRSRSKDGFLFKGVLGMETVICMALREFRGKNHTLPIKLCLSSSI